MMKLILSISILAILISPTFKGFANPHALQNIENVTQTSDCFSNVFSSYDNWFNWLYDKRKNAFIARKTENMAHKLNKFEDNFKKMFLKEQFNNAKKNLDCRFFTYLVGENEVKGVLITPKYQVGNREKTPLIVYNRGGTRNLGSLVFGHVAFELFPIALKGNAIIASDYRSDERYGADNIDEVTALLDIAEKIPNIKSDQIGVYGISRGGLTSLQLAREVPDRISALAITSGVTDGFLWANNMEGIKHNFSIIPEFKENSEEVYTKLSPVRWVDELPDAPILILHSRDDERVSVQHSLSLAERLQELERIYSLKIYQDGGHSLINHKADAIENVSEWFALYIR
jgi:dipeptidyl aminopeptidase/acylaminoacyl peptidase